MASSLIANALQVNFDSVLGIPDNDGMVKMFRALESTGLHSFLGCPSVHYEKELEQFFDTALVKDNEILCVIHSKVVAITEDRFEGVFELPTEGLTDLSEVPKNLVFDARSLFCRSRDPVKTSCKKRKMKYEFRLLNDIQSKSVTVKAGSFDDVTHERFVLMTTIHYEIKFNWRKLLFEALKEMADKSSKRAKGYATQICVMLKGDPAVTLEEAKTFPPLKILSAKTVGTYVATNKTIDARGESYEPDVAKVAVVKRKSVSKKRSISTSNKDTNEVQVEIVAEKTVSKKRPAAASDAPAVKKKRTATGRAAPTEKDLELVTVAHDRNIRKKTIVDDVDKIIDQVLTEIAQLETDVVEPDVSKGVAMGTDLAEPMFLKEPLRSGEDDDISGVEQPSTIIHMEEDSVKNKETDIQLVETGTGKEIDPEPVADEGQIPSDEESLSIDDLLKRIPKDIMLPLRRLAVLKSVRDISAKEEQVLTWAETDSIQVALQRILYIVAKYRELLLRKFLEAHRANYSFSQPWSAMALQIIDLLSAANSTSVKNLLTQKQALKLEWTRPCCAMLFEGDNIDRGFYIPRNHKTIFSTCWVRNVRFIGGTRLVEDGYDRWVCGCAAPVSQLWEQLPQRILLDTLAPIGFFITPAQCLNNSTQPTVKTWGWYRFCTEVLHYFMFGCLKTVGCFNLCTALVPVGSVLGDRSIPRRIVDNVSYCIQIVDSLSLSSTDLFFSDPVVQVDADNFADPVFADLVVQMEGDQHPDPTEFDNFSHHIRDITLQSPGQSNSADFRMLFTAADIPLNDETVVDQLVFPATALPAPDLAESLAQLRTSVSQLSIKQMRTTSSIGDVKNELLSKIDNIEKADAEARTQQDHVFRYLIKSVKQEVQLHKTTLSLEMIEFKKVLRAHSAIVTTDLSDILKEEQYATLRDNLTELIAFFNRGRDDKKGEVGSNRGPADDRSRPGGGGGSRSEPVKRRGSGSQSGPRRRGLEYWFRGE
ncbi:hypothetical protein F511_11917 [Dorcoceras hygrometricum]|uniref:Splicing factor 3B subunit 1-like n=1 Tax=Dorcoceras hygrometricum TaxID=472368 RepID=A0A2Z7CBB3_9LAMI|nr:hypothetical protein F511_11917 [Dorcoceras hygrometricum]